MNLTLLRNTAAAAMLALTCWLGRAAEAEEVPVFITIGQSNADGSAMFDTDEDNRLNTWYSSSANTGNLKIWYRSCQVQNQTSNALNEAARWVVDGTTTDVQPGWLNLWYRNENTSGRTAMNMIHSFGTYSTGSDTNCAQGRRGMEGEFGMKFAEAFPEKELYVIKLGASGSFISSWANPADNHNWTYFYEYMFKPAITDLLARGKRPVLAGIWWMQGCADSAQPQTYYEEWLRKLIEKCRADLGFDNGRFYIGHIVKPGESTEFPTASISFGQGVRDAQDAVAADMEGVKIIDTKDCSFQYEQAFSGYLHFDHKGVNAIGDLLAAEVIADGPDAWVPFSTPGQWTRSGDTAVFTPAIGSPSITYSTDGDMVTATLNYGNWNETKTYTLEPEENYLGPGYLDCDGTRYMTIEHASDFDIAAGSSMTVSAKVWLNSYGTHRGIISNRYHSGTSNATTTGFDIFGGYSATQSMSNNVNLNKGSWNNLGHTWCNTLATEQWAVVTWVLDGTNGTSKMYLDGELKNTRTNTDITNYAINPQCKMLVGARYTTTDGQATTVDNTSYWLGKITNVRFYSKAMTDAEVAADMNATVDATTPDLIAAYDFRDIKGLSVTDISGKGHTGTLVGFPEYVDGSVITIETPVGGTITVMNGSTAVQNGARVPDGTTLTVEATPDTDYTLKEILVNGTAITDGTFTVDGAATVSATFERDINAPTKVLVFDMNENGSKYYRIPALAVAADGSLVALADKRGSSLSDLPNTISVVAKRSTDGGETWSDMVTIAEGDASTGKTYGDPAIVLDRNTGNLIAVFSGDTGFFTSTKTNRAGFYVSKSTDNGVTWSTPVNIADQLYQSSWYGAFAASGRMLQTKSGRIMFVANARLSYQQYVVDVYEYVCASDDGGDTWTVLNPDARIPAAGDGNESKLVETSDGTLIMSIRSSGTRRFAKSTDGGVTWTAATNVNGLTEPSCNGDIMVYPSSDGQTRMLHSLPYDASVRRNVSVLMSYDEGATWPVKKTLIEGYSAYSSLAVLPDGKIGCLVEEGKWDSNIAGEDGFRLYFMKFDLNWLTDGADTNDPDEVFDGTLNLNGSRYMIIPNSDEFNIAAGGKLTVSLRAKLTKEATQTLITNRVRRYENNNNNDVSGWCLYTVPGHTTTSFNYPGSSWTARHCDATSYVSLNEWHHLCWVYDNGTATLYIDGVASATAQTSSQEIPSYCDILVGANYTMSERTKFSIDNLSAFVEGNIDDVRIYGEALTAAEVATDGTAAAPIRDKNIIAAYDFAEIIGDQVTDISGNGHTGTLVGFPDNSPGVALTITAPDAQQGTLEVYNGETPLATGRNVPAGTTLRIVATPAENYILQQVLVNGVAIEPVDGEYTFVIEEATTVSATFERDPNAPIEYCTYTGKISNGNRYSQTLTISDGTTTTTVSPCQTSYTSDVYIDKTETVFNTTAGSEITVKLTEGRGEWMHHYVYIDYNNDGVFTPELSSGNLIPTASSELVAFDRYSDDPNPGETSTYYNSKGQVYTGTGNHRNPNAGGTFPVTVPSFIIPSDLATGTYRIRFVRAWCSINPCGYDQIAANGGAIIDFNIYVTGTTSGIDEVETDDKNAPVEYYNLQGVKVSAGNLAPGIYIRRQGAKATKVFISNK